MTDRSDDADARIEQLRRETAEIVARRQRGLPAYRGNLAPAPATLDRERVEATIAESKTALAAGRFAEALARADTAIGLAGADDLLAAEGWALAGEARLKQGNMGTARTAFTKALTANPAHIRARIGLCHTYRQSHQPERAIPLYMETLPLLPEEGDQRGALLNELSECYREAGQPEMALRVLRQAQPAGASGALAVGSSLLAPRDGIGWLLLVTMGAIIAYLAAFTDIASALLVVIALLCVGAYVGLQWLRLPRRR